MLPRSRKTDFIQPFVVWPTVYCVILPCSLVSEAQVQRFPCPSNSRQTVRQHVQTNHITYTAPHLQLGRHFRNLEHFTRVRGWVHWRDLLTHRSTSARQAAQPS